MDEPTSPPTPTKPGYQTTEFYLSLAATVLTALFASGLLTNNTALAIAGMAATVLTALGYKVSRTLVKTAGAMLLVCLFAGPQLACGAREPAARGVGAFIDCQAPNVVAMLPDAIALAKSAVMRWISGSGHVDTAGLKNAAAPLKTDLGKCAFDAAIAILTSPRPAVAPGAPASSPLEIDTVALRMAWDRARGELGWAPVAGT